MTAMKLKYHPTMVHADVVHYAKLGLLEFANVEEAVSVIPLIAQDSYERGRHDEAEAAPRYRGFDEGYNKGYDDGQNDR